MRSISYTRHGLHSLLAIKTHEEFHDYLIGDAIRRLFATRDELRVRSLSILSICADWKDAEGLRKFPFKSITLSGIHAPSERLLGIIEQDARIRYERQTAEHLSFDSRSFDIVFCKEGLHHLARPVLGLYEMLRVCREGAIFIEGHDGWLNRRLEHFGLSSKYERDNEGNANQRSNYVFRWAKTHLQSLMNSYYLDSGWHIQLTCGWMGSRIHFHRHSLVRNLGITVGWLASAIPGFEGNYLTAIIHPGDDLPVDPRGPPRSVVGSPGKTHDFV